MQQLWFWTIEALVEIMQREEEGGRVADEIAPGLFLVPIPLGDNPLGRVNAYAVRASDGIHLVDCGWNTPEAYAALAEGLEAVGGGIESVRELLITHIHPDHYGLTERIAWESGARVLMHRLDAIYLGARYEDVEALVEQMSAWLRINGVPSPDLEVMTAGSLEMIRRVGTRRPDRLLEGDEVLEWGEYAFRVIWAPGHSTGLICLHEPSGQLLLSSDHILERISPHVGLHAQSLGNPLADYLESLASMRELPVRTILPGHGGPFRDLPSRVDELLAHHQSRLATISDLLQAGPQTAYQISGVLSWKGSQHGWATLEPFQRRMAVTEVIAHLEYLHNARKLGKQHREGIVYFHREDDTESTLLRGSRRPPLVPRGPS